MTAKKPEKVRQHTVPKSYLKGFTLEGDQLVQYDRDTGKAMTVNIKDASVVKRIYSLQQADGKWNDSIEDYFMRLETDAIPRLDRLAQGHLPTHQDKCIMALHIARQMQRGRFLADFAQREASKFLDHEFTLKILEANQQKFIAKHGKTFETALEEFKQAKHGFEIDPKTYLRYILPETPAIAAPIADFHWRIERARGAYFVTSDNPVCVRRRGEPVNPRVVGLLLPNAELYFPLNKTTMLIVSQVPSRDWKRTVRPARVRELNRIIVISAFRFVYAPAVDPEIEALIQEHMQDRIRFEDMPWGDG